MQNDDRELLNNKKNLLIHKKLYKLTAEALGKVHPSTLDYLNDLAICHGNIGNYKKALKLHKKCYRLRKETLGDFHIDTLTSINNLANIYYHIKNFKKYEINIKKYFKSINNQMYNSILIRHDLDYKGYFNSFLNSTKNYLEYYFKNMNSKEGYCYISAYKNIVQDISFFENSLKKIPRYQKNIDYLFEIDKKIEQCNSKKELLNLHKETEAINKQLNNIAKRYIQSLTLDINYKMIQERIEYNDIIIDYYEIKDKYYGIIIIGKQIFKSMFLERKNNSDLVKGIEKYLDKSFHIYICPDGELYNISFERILKDYDVSYLSSPKALFCSHINNNQFFARLNFNSMLIII